MTTRGRALQWWEVLALLLGWMLAQPLAWGATASYYSTEACSFNQDARCPTASGKSLYDLEREGILFAAMWEVPFGSRYRVCRADQPSRCVVVAIWDRGPARRLKREIDLGKRAFSRLAPLSAGVIRVTVEALPR